MKWIAFVLLFLSTSACAVEWTRIREIDTYVVYVDLATIRKTGSTATMWTLFDYKQAQHVRGTTHLSMIVQGEFDCSEAQQTRRLYLVFYSENMQGGNVVWSGQGDRKWEPMVPGTTGESLWQFLCKLP